MRSASKLVRPRLTSLLSVKRHSCWDRRRLPPRQSCCETKAGQQQIPTPTTFCVLPKAKRSIRTKDLRDMNTIFPYDFLRFHPAPPDLAETLATAMTEGGKKRRKTPTKPSPQAQREEGKAASHPTSCLASVLRGVVVARTRTRSRPSLPFTPTCNATMPLRYFWQRPRA